MNKIDINKKNKTRKKILEFLYIEGFWYEQTTNIKYLSKKIKEKEDIVKPQLRYLLDLGMIMSTIKWSDGDFDIAIDTGGINLVEQEALK